MKKFIIYSDFDGTITTYDAFDKIIQEVYSYATYKKLERLLVEHNLPSETYLEMFNGIHYDITPLADDVDKTFKEFYEWIQKNGLEFYIVSAGFKTIIRHVLPYVDPSIIYSNDFTYNEDQTWKVNDTLPIQKTEIIEQHQKPNHTSIYLGDGLSDFKVIGKVDYLFCKKDSMIHKKCVLEKHNHYVFTDFKELQEQFHHLDFFT